MGVGGEEMGGEAWEEAAALAAMVAMVVRVEDLAGDLEGRVASAVILPAAACGPRVLHFCSSRPQGSHVSVWQPPRCRDVRDKKHTRFSAPSVIPPRKCKIHPTASALIDCPNSVEKRQRQPGRAQHARTVWAALLVGSAAAVDQAFLAGFKVWLVGPPCSTQTLSH